MIITLRVHWLFSILSRFPFNPSAERLIGWQNAIDDSQVIGQVESGFRSRKATRTLFENESYTLKEK